MALPAIGAVAVAIVAASGAGCPPPRTLCPGCNIVLLTIDTLRADHVGAYGYVRNTSPRIDELARESVLFEQAIIAWPKTVPGLGSILTGNYGHTIRMMYATFDPMLEESTTISEMLQQEGYKTGGFTANANLSIERGWNQGFDEYVELWDTAGRVWPRNVAKHGRAFIAAHKAGRFFLWLHYLDPHAPYTAFERRFRFRFVDDAHYDRIFYDQDRKRKLDIHRTPPYTWRTFGINGIPKHVSERDKTDVAYYIAEYDAEVVYTDAYVGAVIDELKEHGLWDRTIVVVTADHGEALGDHDSYFDHGRFGYDDVSRVPLVLYIPGVRPLRASAPVSSNDIVPTLLELVGVEQRIPMDGRSLVPVITGEQDRVAEHVFNEAGYNRDYQRTVRDGTWKLIYAPAPEARSVMQGRTFELYNTKKDPLETKNLVDEEPEVARRLENVLFEWMEERMPPLRGYELLDGISAAYTVDFDFPDIAVEGDRFYAKVRGSNRRRSYCFTLPVPDPDARILIELLEGNRVERPYAGGKSKWDDPGMEMACVGDEWGCLRVGGEPVEKIPHAVRLGDLQERVEPTPYVSMHGQGNDKTFCFQTGEFNKRREQSAVGYVVEVMGVVERGSNEYRELDEATRRQLRELGYLQ
jgi:arylsulfatase